MKRAIAVHRRDFAAVTALLILAIGTVAYILSHQPSFTFGKNYYTVYAQFSTGAAITPGQGQAVTIAGVEVGQIGGIHLAGGQAVVKMNIYKKYAPIYRDATVLLRPRTPLKDMYLSLDPGTRPAGAIPDNGALSAASTSADIDVDQILSSLDSDTRTYLLLLLDGGAQVFRDHGTGQLTTAPSPAAVAALRGTFKRFAPLNRDTETFASLLATRRRNITRAIHNLQLVSGAVGGVEGQLASLIRASNTNFTAISDQDAQLRQALTLLPPTLATTTTTLGKVQGFANASTQTLPALLPFAHALAPALEAARPLFKDTTPVIQHQLRPFSVAITPLAQTLDAGSSKLARATPNLVSSVGVLNALFNTLAYQPGGGGKQSYLFWGSWLSHIANSLTAQQDAHGPIVRGLFLATCTTLNLLEVTIQVGSPSLGPLLDLLNAPDWSKIHSPFSPALDGRRRGSYARPRRHRDGGNLMQKKAPGASQILTMLIFALSCIGLLIFLWMSFGGSVPLAPQGYRFQVEFDQAVQLADQSDVRISGVNVGKVVSVALDRNTGLTKATIQIDRQFAPRPADTRAILRQKSLLGETYVELSPGSRGSPALPDGGTLPRGQVEPTVQLDQILSTFDPATRRAFQVWMQSSAVALTGRGQDFNNAIGSLYPFATNVDSVLTVLNRDSVATSTLLRDGGQVFGALGKVPAQVQGFVRNSNTVFATTAAQDRALAAAIRAFPAFLIATRTTVNRTTRFAVQTQPLIDELRPAAVQLTPALQSVAISAPELKSLMINIAPLTAASVHGVPALESFLRDSVPWLRRARPYLGGIVPVLDYLNDFRRELAAFFANGAATTQDTLQNNEQNKLLHVLRISNPVNPETLAVYQNRLETNRGNPYPVPGSADRLASGLSVFGAYLCTSHPLPSIGPSIPANLASVLQSVYYTSDPSGPPCQAQPSLGAATTGQLQSFPQLQPLR